MVRGGIGAAWMPAVLFFPALLSKEAAVALPLAPAGWSTVRLRGSTMATIVRVAPWLLILGIYSALRQFAGGVSAVVSSAGPLAVMPDTDIRRTRAPSAASASIV